MSKFSRMIKRLWWWIIPAIGALILTGLAVSLATPRGLGVNQFGGEAPKDTLILPTPDDGSPTASIGGDSALAYVRQGNIWVTSSQNSRSKRVTSDARNAEPSWAPDGSRLVYIKYPPVLEATEVVGGTRSGMLWAVDVRSRNETPLRVGNASQPRWAPSGDEIAYVYQGSELRILDLKSRLVRTVVGGPRSDNDRLWSPRWLPDGGLVFVRLESSWHGVDDRLDNLWLLDKSGEERRLTAFKVPEVSEAPYAWTIIRAPVWDEKSGNILFIKGWHDNNPLAAPHFELWQVGTDGSGSGLIKELEREVYLAAASSDGTKVWYTVPQMSVSANGAEVFQLRLADPEAMGRAGLGESLLDGISSVSLLE